MTAAILYGSGHYPNDDSGHVGRSDGQDHNATCFGTISWKERTLNDDSGHSLLAAAITLTMAAAVIYGSRRWLRGISDLVSLVHFGRSGGRNHNATCFGTISWKERTLNDGSGHFLRQRPLASRNF